MKFIKLLTLATVAILFSSASSAQQFRALVFTKTAAWHHESGHAAVDAIKKLGEQHHFEVFWTENA